MAAHLYDDYLRHFPPLPSLLIPYPRPYNNNNYNGGSCIDDLCDTLLELIFTRLVQWRHLVTCKLVSKRWNSIISNPYFSRGLTNKYTPFTLILRNRSTDDCLISEHPYFRTHKLGLSDIFPNIYNINACHNDILVLNDRFAFKIGNPLTKQFILVPKPLVAIYSDCKVGFAGVVNGVSTIDVPNPTNNVIGFRIILIDTGYCYANNLRIQIYYSVTGKWKTYNNVTDLGFEFSSWYGFDPRNQAVTSNNRVHWRGKSNKILVVDLYIVSYCVLNLPGEIYVDSVLGSCQNRIRIAQFESNPVTSRIKVWEFDEDDELMNWGGNSMAKLRLVINFALKPRLYDPVFSPSEILLSMSCLRLRNEVICCHPNDPDIVYVMYRNRLVECDVGERRLRVIRDCTTSWSRRFMLVHPLMAP